MKTQLLSSLLCISLLLSNTLLADENLEDDLGGFGSEELLEGFSDDLETQEEETVVVQSKKSNLSVSGDVAFKSSLAYHKHEVDGVEYSGINQAQVAFSLQLDYKISDDWKVRISGDTYYDGVYDLYKSNIYNREVLDTYQTSLLLDDAYIQGRITKNIDLKIGHQVVVWGKSDSIRVTDVINPLDNRVPGLTDIEDLRLSVGMLKLDYYVGAWNFSAMVIPESKIMLESAPRGEFFPVDAVFPLGAPNPFIELVTPDSSIDNPQYAFAVNGVFSGWDLSFYGADVLDQKWHINPATLKREVSRVKMLGSALNIAKGSWLLKSEVAYLDGVKYNSTTDDKSRLDLLIGFDYMGIKDTVLSMEIANRHIFDYEKQMSELIGRPDYVDEDELQTALRVTRSFENDSINATALLSMFGQTWEYGGFARVWVEVELMDALSSNFGVVDYIDGDKPFTKAIADNDRLFADITYSF